MTDEDRERITDLEEENARLRASLRAVTDSLNDLLLDEKFPKFGRHGSDQYDFAQCWWEDRVSQVQGAYAGLAGVSVLAWREAHPGLIDLPPGPVRFGLRTLRERGLNSTDGAGDDDGHRKRKLP